MYSIFFRLLLILHLTFVIACCTSLNAQSVPNDAEIKTAILYNFTQHFDWATLSRSDSFLIGIYGVDSVMYQSLKRIEQQNIKNRGTKVLLFPHLHDIYKTDVLYVNHARNFEIEKIYRLIKRTNTLLVTDRCEDKQVVMVNFIHDEISKKISFEINKRNLDDESMTMSPKILLLGGTEIDIRDLYLQTEKVLEQEKIRVSEVESKLIAKENELEGLNNEIGQLQREITARNEVIGNQQTSINFQNKRLLFLQDSLQLIAEKTRSQSVLLEQLNQSLNSGNKEKELLDKQLASKIHEVDSVSNKLDTLYTNIAQQEEVLFLQVREISYLRKSRQIIFFGLLLFALLVITALRSYFLIRKKNRVIEDKSSQLVEKSDSLQHANQELKVQAGTLEKTLETLHKTQDQLVESKKMASLGQLSSGIAHEINNPVNFISSSIEGLKVVMEDVGSIMHKYNEVTTSNYKEKLDEIEQMKENLEFQEMLVGFGQLINNIKNGADRTKEIVNSMRVFYRSGDKFDSKVNLNLLLGSTIKLISKKVEDKISVETSYGDIPEIECQPGMINQVMLNILENGIQAINGKGRIKVRTLEIGNGEKNSIRVEIEDSGMGMSEEVQNKIFDPFFTTKDVGKGTGLGMYLSYNIIKKHQGEIKVQSEPNKGSTFLITLPIKQPENNS